ncbi:MAG: hypothetical protein WCK73_15895 [Deltaproteobacteria bacterium]
MTESVETWEARRFFVPNEDAGVVRAALGLCSPPPVAPLFVGGSGMVLLDAASDHPSARATYVDVSRHQIEYFRSLAAAISAARTAQEARTWFETEVYPQMSEYYRSRGKDYPLEQVLAALRDLFRIRFFFSDEALARARVAAREVAVVTADVVAYLAATPRRHDYLYLSNVPDYLAPERSRALFGACRRHRAPVYLLVTSATPDAGLLRRVWMEEGYREEPRSGSLDADNRGLGAKGLERSWNRPGKLCLLTIDEAAACRADEAAAHVHMGHAGP